MGFVDEVKIWISVIIVVGNTMKPNIIDVLNVMTQTFHRFGIYVFHVQKNLLRARVIPNLVLV